LDVDQSLRLKSTQRLDFGKASVFRRNVDQSLRLKSTQRLDFGKASVFRRNGGSGEIALVHPLINLVPDPENMPS